jgi:hypothetical protein
VANATQLCSFAPVRLVAAGSLLLALAMGSHASAQSLDGAAKASNELGGRVQLLRSQYVTVAEFRSQNDAVTKIADAQLRYRISDWDAASILLAQVVDEPRYAASAGLRDAKFMFADSLFHLRNFDLAKKHFRDLVATKDANYALKAARRLLEMAYIDGDYSDLDAMFSEFANSEMGNFGPDVAYMRGKAQYGQGNYEAALASFAGVKGDSILELRAAYFAGVTRARLGQLEESRQAFEAIIQQLAKKKGDAQRELLNLSRLGRARIYYEQQSALEREGARKSITLHARAHHGAISPLPHRRASLPSSGRVLANRSCTPSSTLARVRVGSSIYRRCCEPSLCLSLRASCAGHATRPSTTSRAACLL